MTLKRLSPDFKPENIYIATGKRYKGIIEPHVNEIPKENFIFEPEMRDVGPAVGLAMAIIGKEHPDTPVAILWSDHSVKKRKKI